MIGFPALVMIVKRCSCRPQAWLPSLEDEVHGDTGGRASSTLPAVERVSSAILVSSPLSLSMWRVPTWTFQYCNYSLMASLCMA